MKRAIGTRFGSHQLLALAAALALAGCEEGFVPAIATPEEAESETVENDDAVELFPQAANGEQRDVEAPEIFQITEAGLWDGRPSLGGIWVAHPDVAQPERVRIVNTTNNKSVTGALFRRERNLPGPALQVSSAAAEELGLLAGAPTRVEVVALRREAITPTPPPAEPEADTTELASVETDTAVDDTSADDGAETPAKRKWWQKKSADDASGAVAGAAVAGAAAGAAIASDSEDESQPEATESSDTENTESAAQDAEEKPKKRKWWQKKPAEDTATGAVVAGAATGAAVAAEAGASAASDAAEAGADVAVETAALTDPVVTAPDEAPKKRKWWQKKDPQEITETPLDPIAGAAAAIDAAEPTATEAAAAAAGTSAAVSNLSQPYVQVGTFSVQSNANSAAEKIRRNGMSAEVRELKTDENTIWRVLVGPAKTRAERRAILSDVKDLGFTDAFTAKN
ncbi:MULTISPECIES: SPOR domain-containing protein [unclassified Ruegeria]|uniref:SPOR domain-containing protein n=1 Tax=unclassified Ruegeria TaxID=2625375 RepID=UPI0014876261|nr:MULTISPECIES: SPOR domain-containing protein [unclassified Ruegeria]